MAGSTAGPAGPTGTTSEEPRTEDGPSTSEWVVQGTALEAKAAKAGAELAPAAPAKSEEKVAPAPEAKPVERAAPAPEAKPEEKAAPAPQAAPKTEEKAAPIAETAPKQPPTVAPAGKTDKAKTARVAKPPTTEEPAADAVEAEDEGRLSWLERRHAGRIARAAEKLALERLAEANEQVRQGLDLRLSEATTEATKSMEDRLEKAGSGFGAVLKGAREVVAQLREQVTQGQAQLKTLQERGAEVRVQAAAAQDTVHDTLQKSLQELKKQGDEQVSRMSDTVQEVSSLAENLRKEFSTRTDSAVARVDQASKELDARAAGLTKAGEELEDKMTAAGKRVASWERKAEELIERAARDLKAEGDRQTERLEGRIEVLEAQRVRLQQQTTAVQKEGAAAREQAVGLEEMVKTATTELATLIGAAERELDERLVAGKRMVDSAREDGERERERWDQLRASVAAELADTAREVRELFLVQLAAIKSRVEAVAEAGGLEAPALDDVEASLADWTPQGGGAEATGEVDLNSAGLAELRALGMTLTQARRVIEHRERAGRFDAVDRLDDVPGFTRDQRASLKRRVVAR